MKNWIIFHDDIHEPINSTDLGQNNRNVEKIFRHKTLKKNLCIESVPLFFLQTYGKTTISSDGVKNLKRKEYLYYLPLILRDVTVKHFHANVLEFLSKLATIYIAYPSTFHDDPTNCFHEKFSSPESKQIIDI